MQRRRGGREDDLEFSFESRRRHRRPLQSMALPRRPTRRLRTGRAVIRGICQLPSSVRGFYTTYSSELFETEIFRQIPAVFALEFVENIKRNPDHCVAGKAQRGKR